jgi:hypothetical protein
MATCMRLAPVLLIALLGVIGPPGRSPGSRPGESPLVLTVKCPGAGCGWGTWRKRERKYRCDECEHFFNYCSWCQSPFWDDESRKHNHQPG